MEAAERHPLWLRIAHWALFPVLALMVWSGILIYWANDVYDGFFPAWFYRAFSIDHRLAEGMAIHFTLAWFLVAIGLFYLVLSLATGHWREISPDRQSLRALPPTILKELGLRREPVDREGKFNAVQRLAYSALILCAMVEVLSGFAVYKPVQLGWLAAGFGGYEGARWVHFVAMLGIVVFFAVHVVQVARAGWGCLRSMIAGFEVRRP